MALICEGTHIKWAEHCGRRALLPGDGTFPSVVAQGLCVRGDGVWDQPRAEKEWPMEPRAIARLRSGEHVAWQRVNGAAIDRGGWRRR